MLYCPGKGHELLSALGVTVVCHASNVFLVLKVSLSITDAFSKSMAWLLDQVTADMKSSEAMIFAVMNAIFTIA